VFVCVLVLPDPGLVKGMPPCGQFTGEHRLSVQAQSISFDL